MRTKRALVKVASRAKLRAWMLLIPSFAAAGVAFFLGEDRSFQYVTFALMLSGVTIVMAPFIVVLLRGCMIRGAPEPADYHMERASFRNENPVILAGVPVGIGGLLLVALLVPDAAGGISGVLAGFASVFAIQFGVLSLSESRHDVSYAEPVVWGDQGDVPDGCYLCRRQR
ncbi:MAG TPA: hypothetical protein VFV09_01090 [Actinomycetota bacterium]|nr:hypothetical protein [Actinomycetota bacterium]